ncbi:putative reverse transcriptase domain-containing protein [Tanacetum coccineum]
MPPRKAPRTRTTPATTTNTTSITNAQLQKMIDPGVTAALATRDANRSTNGEDSHNSGMGVRRTERVARECTYQDFMKCQPLYFKGTKGVVKLTQWFERMETVFRISNCYNQRFQELALLCVRMFPEESDKIESTIVERQAENKRMFENASRNNQNQQQQNKRQNTGRAYTTWTGEKNPYGGSKPLCAKCNYHHDGPCTPKCHKCNKFGHFARDCRSAGNANNANNQRGTGQAETYVLRVRVRGHFKRKAKVKNNKNHGNQVGNDRAPAKVYA